MQIGKMPENALRRSVLRQIQTKREEVLHGAGIGEDCAIFSFGEETGMAVCTQEAVVAAGREMAHMETGDAVEEPAADSGSAGGAVEKAPAGGPAAGGFGAAERFLTMADLIQKCANNLAAGGARPVAATIALLLPVHTEEPQVRALMAAAQEKCRELSMEIAGGQTRVTAGVLQPVAVVTAYGRVLQGKGCSIKAARPGQDVVLSKWIGLQGTALIARRHRGRLRERYPAYLVEEAAGFHRYFSVLPEAEVALANGVCAMHDASEGGILAGLWELAEGAGTGLTIDMRKLPLRQETVEVCECCGVNPYELLSGGCLIMTAWDGPGLLGALEAARIPAALVGKVTDSRDRILVNGEEIRYLDRPRTDSIYTALA